MQSPDGLFENNRRWAASRLAAQPDFFQRLVAQQRPDFLWIGCSDSRVPANEIVGLMPGELFVHRNLANVVVHTDLNCLSVLQFAVDVLEVEHVIVCGHYGCAGVQAALAGARLGLIDNWLRHVADVRDRHDALLASLGGAAERADCLCELNVITQVRHVGETTVMQEAWARGQRVAVHGWVYALHDGLLRDLGTSVTGPAEVEPAYRQAVRRAARRGPPGGP